MKEKTLHKKLLYKKEIKLISDKNLVKNYSINILNCFIMTAKQLECIRILFRRELKKKGSILLSPCFDIPYTRKPSGIRMGKGKGSVYIRKSRLNINNQVIQFNCKNLRVAIQVFKKISFKLPISLFMYSKIDKKYYYIIK